MPEASSICAGRYAAKVTGNRKSTGKVINAFVFDKATTNELSNIFEDDKRQSTFLTQAEYKKKSAWKRFVGWFAHLFIPVL